MLLIISITVLCLLIAGYIAIIFASARKQIVDTIGKKLNRIKTFFTNIRNGTMSNNDHRVLLIIVLSLVTLCTFGICIALIAEPGLAMFVTVIIGATMPLWYSWICKLIID